MPKVHDIGKKHFYQILTNYRVIWGKKIAVKGSTQEIEEPFRYAEPLIVRLPFNNALVFGKWLGVKDEEEALSGAIQERVLTDEDFLEGWTPPAVKATEESSLDWYL
jgi:hypothetical protein